MKRTGSSPSHAGWSAEFPACGTKNAIIAIAIAAMAIQNQRRLWQNEFIPAA
jgi:hypothetical protein